ncbi:hypothetical protein Tcan_10385 [Toxocara canis]|uniref:Uncharacterized protein n=1 Tax=Toxocara canis TaxID=6265 RepID=A0A0B2VR73_TOXCA|nr:hypothetical protein Tcan_10385 [Toxocara canis]
MGFNSNKATKYSLDSRKIVGIVGIVGNANYKALRFTSSEMYAGHDESLLKLKVNNASTIADSSFEKCIKDGGGLSDAKVWPCRTCGILLGICHLVLGITLLLFDIFTNSLSETAFAITAALAFIVCALFAFIAARRLDRPAQLLLLFFSLFALAMSTTMFVESAAVINHNCDHADCHGHENIVHTILLCFALTELTVSLATIMVCFRSLRKAYGINKAASPYSTLIEGDYSIFRIKPRVVASRRSEGHSPVMLHYLLR